MGFALVGHQHQRLTEGLRSRLLASFDGVFMVADATSLKAGARKLQPELIVVDLSLAAGRLGALLGELRQAAPHGRVLVLSDHDEPRVDALILSGGADGVVHKAALVSELAVAVDTLLAGQRFGNLGSLS